MGSALAATAGLCWLIAPQAAEAQTAAQNAVAPETIAPTAITDEINGNLATNGIDSTSYDRGRNISVRQRPRPDYDAIGVDVPGFVIYPKVDLGFAYDSNIFAQHTGAVGDEIFNVSPEVDFSSTWSRNSLAGYAKVSQDLYFSHDSEDATEADAGLVGKVNLGQNTITAGGEYGRFVLPRWASNNFGLSIHRIPYDYGAANLELAHEFVRVRLSARMDFQDYQFGNGRTAAGVLVFDQDQNHSVTTGTIKAEYAYSPDTAFYLTADYNGRRYDLQPPAVP
ncbi:MAG: outer membrane beta-barrel protein, partial [Caulobacteraceae bacterium]